MKDFLLSGSYEHYFSWLDVGFPSPLQPFRRFGAISGDLKTLRRNGDISWSGRWPNFVTVNTVAFRYSLTVHGTTQAIGRSHTVSRSGMSSWLLWVVGHGISLVVEYSCQSPAPFSKTLWRNFVNIFRGASFPHHKWSFWVVFFSKRQSVPINASQRVNGGLCGIAVQGGFMGSRAETRMI